MGAMPVVAVVAVPVVPDYEVTSSFDTAGTEYSDRVHALKSYSVGGR